MIVTYAQIVQEMTTAKAAHPETLVGSRINYCFKHPCDESKDGVGICGLFGWVYKQEDQTPSGEISLTIAFDTTIEGFFVTDDVCVIIPDIQLAGDSTTLYEATNAKSIAGILDSF